MWDRLLEMMQEVFGGDVPVEPLAMYQVAARAAVVYFIGLLLVRLGKSRIISHASVMDVILGFILGSILSRGITGSASMSGTITASAVLIGVHWAFSAGAFYSHTLGNLFKGRKRILVQDGELQWDAMRESHISLEDLLQYLRLNANLDDLSKVRVAYKERSGEVSVVKAD